MRKKIIMIVTALSLSFSAMLTPAAVNAAPAATKKPAGVTTTKTPAATGTPSTTGTPSATGSPETSGPSKTPADSGTSKTAADENSFKWPVGPSIVSESAILMDASTGTILYEKDAYTKRYPASITKILTGLIALENSSLEDEVTFSKDAIYSLETGSTHIGMRPGEILTMKDCLYGLLLASANEVANAIAEHISGSKAEFASLMNSYAAALGCKNSHFVNPSGLFDADHYTCCYDMALISRAALANETFRNIDCAKSYVIPATNLVDEKRPISNHHQMLTGYKSDFEQYKYDGCIGGKTGYTDIARNTLVTFASRNGMELICVVMKSTTHDQYKDTIALMDFGFNNYSIYDFSNESDVKNMADNDELFNRYFTLADSSRSLIYTDGHTDVVLPKGADKKDVKTKIKYFTTVTLEKGENFIGRITYTFDKKTVGQTKIYLNLENDELKASVKLPKNLKTIEVDTTENEEKSFLPDLPYKKIGIIAGASLAFILLMVLIAGHLKRGSRRRRYSSRRGRNRGKSNRRLRY